MPELTEILTAKRESEVQEKRFLAALQGVELDEGIDDAQKIWEEKKAKAFSNGVSDSKDILSLQGYNAAREGFGIGMGIDYTDAKDLENPSW
jgi:hypothetical protein